MTKNAYTAYCMKTPGLNMDTNDARQFAETLVPPVGCGAAVYCEKEKSYLVFWPNDNGEEKPIINLDDYEHFATLCFRFASKKDLKAFERQTDIAADSIVDELRKHTKTDR